MESNFLDFVSEIWKKCLLSSPEIKKAPCGAFDIEKCNINYLTFQ